MEIKDVLENNRQMQEQINNLQLQLANRLNNEVYSIPVYESFSFVADDWRGWKTGFERYRVATKANCTSQNQQINQLLLHMGKGVDTVFLRENKTVSEFQTYEEVVTFFDEIYKKQVNIIFERAQFNKRNQREGESGREYVQEIKRMANTCQYGSLTDQLIRDRLVVGIWDEKLSEVLQLDEDLTCSKAIDKILQYENVREQNKMIRGGVEKATLDINKVERSGKRFGRKPQYSSPQYSSRDSSGCERCGSKVKHATVNACPAIRYAVKCHKCQKIGHYARRCRTLKIGNVEHSEDEDDEPFLEQEEFVQEGAQPYAANCPRRIPFPLMEPLRLELKKMLKHGIIREVSEPTEWCAPIVVARKKNGKIRLCTDYTELNKFVIRERLLLPTVDETLAKISGSKYFTKLDCSSGFWQLCLDEESSRITTFITPFGRYAYQRLPFGITSAPEVFQKALNGVIGHLPGVTVHADDILITGTSVQQHDANVRAVLNELKANNITLNKEKCEFNIKSVKYLGYIVSENGVSIDPDNVRAMREYPRPNSVTEVRRFLGMFNYITKFIAEAAKKTGPLRELLHKDKVFMWTSNHQKCFDQLKDDLCKTPVLALYNPKYETRVSADASANAIGGTLEQRQEDGTWKVVLFCSASLTETQKRYGQIEKEALAILKTVERLQQYLVGLHFQIITDHKPLVSVLKTKAISDLTPRLQKMRMHLIRFSYDITHIPGKEMHTADALSRAPLKDLCQYSDEDIEQHQEMLINAIQATTSLDVETITNFQKNDPICQKIREYILKGWPEKNARDFEGGPYFKHKAEISLVKDALFYKDRLLIPATKRKQCLTELHRGHLGLVKCNRRAKASVWWPGLGQDLENLINNCEICLKSKSQVYEPFVNLETPSTPWATVGTDLCEFKDGKYLVVEDYYSKYPELVRLRSTTSEAVIEALKNIFARHGIPRVVRSDNGPQYSSYKFKQFAQAWNFKHVTSSPHMPSSNGLAESAVKTVKNILKKEDDPQLGLLTYRNTPLACGATPAQLLMARKLRDTLPIQESHLKPKLPKHEEVRANMKREKQLQEKYFNKSHKVKKLEELKPADRVWIRDLQREARVIKKTEEPRSYLVQTKDERKMRRNRRFLTKLPAAESIQTLNMSNNLICPQISSKRTAQPIRRQATIVYGRAPIMTETTPTPSEATPIATRATTMSSTDVGTKMLQSTPVAEDPPEPTGYSISHAEAPSPPSDVAQAKATSPWNDVAQYVTVTYQGDILSDDSSQDVPLPGSSSPRADSPQVGAPNTLLTTQAVTQRPSDQDIQKPGDQDTQRPGDQDTQRPGDQDIPQPADTTSKRTRRPPTRYRDYLMSLM